MHGTCISSCLEIACYCSDFLGNSCGRGGWGERSRLRVKSQGNSLAGHPFLYIKQH